MAKSLDAFAASPEAFDIDHELKEWTYAVEDGLKVTGIPGAKGKAVSMLSATDISAGLPRPNSYEDDLWEAASDITQTPEGKKRIQQAQEFVTGEAKNELGRELQDTVMEYAQTEEAKRLQDEAEEKIDGFLRGFTGTKDADPLFSQPKHLSLQEFDVLADDLMAELDNQSD